MISAFWSEWLDLNQRPLEPHWADRLIFTLKSLRKRIYQVTFCTIFDAQNIVFFSIPVKFTVIALDSRGVFKRPTGIQFCDESFWKRSKKNVFSWLYYMTGKGTVRGLHDRSAGGKRADRSWNVYILFSSGLQDHDWCDDRGKDKRNLILRSQIGSVP